jgi:AcrR family transcriptional regulator
MPVAGSGPKGGEPTPTRSRGGRSLDPSRDQAIRAAVLTGLAEVGYEGLTMDLVAARARAGKGALYRRWPSKAALVIDAISQVRPAPVMADQGSLRADLELLARLAAPDGTDGPEVEIMLGLVTAAQRDPELAEALRTGFLEPRKAPIRAVLERARDRGELRADVDIDLIVEVVPAMVVQRAIFQRVPPDHAFIVRVLRTVVLPALLHGPVPPDAPYSGPPSRSTRTASRSPRKARS